MRYELKIETDTPEYVGALVVCLARQGYSPYITDDGDVAFTITDDELTELK